MLSNIVLTVLMSFILLTITFFRWSMFDDIFFVSFLLVSAAWVFYVLLFLFNIFLYVKQKKAHVLHSLIIQILIAFSLLTPSLDGLWLKYNFLSLKQEREQFLNYLTEQQVAMNPKANFNVYQVPPLFKKISLGGNEVIIWKSQNAKFVLFYTFRGVLDNYSGFVYVPEDSNLATYLDANKDVPREIIKMDNSWFYVSYN